MTVFFFEVEPYVFLMKQRMPHDITFHPKSISHRPWAPSSSHGKTDELLLLFLGGMGVKKSGSCGHRNVGPGILKTWDPPKDHLI